MLNAIHEGVSSMRVCDFIAWANDSIEGKPTAQPLGLPPIQRTALWTPRQILGLWDSLLRGMPIGVFYLIPARSERRPLVEHGQVDPNDNGLDLLDGQQRLRAMLLAVRAPAKMGKCLWVDFGAKTKATGTLVPLRLTTKSQPFGYKEDGTKLSLEDRRKARAAFDDACKNVAGYCKNTFDHKLFDLQLDEHSPPRPKSDTAHPSTSTALPLTQLFENWRSTRDKESFTAAVKKRLQQTVSSHVERNICLLADGMARLDSADVAIILHRLDEDGGKEGSEWLLRWFENIGAGGTALSSAERSYSIYKHYEPGIYDVVSSIERDVGHVMSPVDIVGTALRIASAQINDFFLPDHTAFAKATVERSTNSLWKELHILIPKDSQDGSGPLAIAFKQLYDTLRYHKESNPRGLPALMLAELHPSVLQVLIYWTVLTLRSPKIAVDLGRDEMIRFALFWALCSDNNEKGARRAFEFLKNRTDHEEAGFPGYALYCHLTDPDRTALSLVSPEDFRKYGDLGPIYGTWRNWDELFGRKDMPGVALGTKELFRAWWQSGGKMLLWLQRRYLTEQFPKYNPSSDRDEEKPYDLDHIQPKESWRADWRTQERRLLGDPKDHFYYGRDHLGNSIGNFRWVGSSENRSDGKLGLREKLRLKEPGKPSAEITPAETGPTEPDWKLGIFDEEAQDLWWKAGGGDSWSADRIAAFQQAVEQRTVWLYGQWWKQAGFDQWKLGLVTTQ